MILPSAKVRDEILPDLFSHILTGVGIQTFPFTESIEGNQADWKKHTSILVLSFSLSRLGGLRHYPLAFHAVRGEDQQQLVMEPDSFIDLFVDLASSLYVVRSKPAADSLRLE